MLFLTDVDHVSFEKANGTRQNNLQSATVSLQVVIGLCKRKETAALKSKPPFQMRVSNCLLYDGFFSFDVARQITYSFYFELLLCYLMSAIGMNRQECKHNNSIPAEIKITCGVQKLIPPIFR